MPTFSGFGVANAYYTVNADDKNQAIDFIFDLVKEDFPDADNYEVVDIQEI